MKGSFAANGSRPISRVEYCRNFIFKRHFPIHKLFESGCDLRPGRLGSRRRVYAFGNAKATKRSPLAV